MKKNEKNIAIILVSLFVIVFRKEIIDTFTGKYKKRMNVSNNDINKTPTKKYSRTHGEGASTTIWNGYKWSKQTFKG